MATKSNQTIQQSSVKIVRSIWDAMDIKLERFKKWVMQALKDYRVGTGQISAGAITGSKLATDSVSARIIRAGSITTPKIHTEAITGDHLSLSAKSSITTSNRNILKDSTGLKETSTYLIAEYDTEGLVASKDYTVVLEGTVNTGQQILVMFNDGTSGTVSAPFESDGVAVIRTKTPSSLSSQKIRLYNYPSSTAVQAQIFWACMYKGYITSPPRDWTPSIQETAAQIDANSTAISDLATTVSSKTTIFYQTSAPTTDNVGDMWYDTDASPVKIYRWSGSSWYDVTTTALSAALSAAASAQATADGKIRTYAQTTAPTGLTSADVGDLWIDTDDENKMYRWSGIAWVVVQDGNISSLTEAITNLNYYLNSSITIFYQTSQPTATATGDVWYDTDSSPVIIRRWTGSAWVDITTTSLAQALKAAADAQSTADGKIKSYAQTTAPTGLTAKDVGDLWIDTDDGNKLYRWNGSSWAVARDATLDAVDPIIQDFDGTYGSLTTIAHNTAYIGSLPPTDPTKYISWINTGVTPPEQLRWTGNSTNTARSYPASISGSYPTYPDQSDDHALKVSVDVVTQQSGFGDPSPSFNVRPITGRTSIPLKRYSRREQDNIVDLSETSVTGGSPCDWRADNVAWGKSGCAFSLNGYGATYGIGSIGELMLEPGKTYTISFWAWWWKDESTLTPSGKLHFNLNNAAHGYDIYDDALGIDVSGFVNSLSRGTPVLYRFTFTMPASVSGTYDDWVLRFVQSESHDALENYFASDPRIHCASSDSSDWTVAPAAASIGIPYVLTPSASLYGITGYVDGINNYGGESHKTKFLTLNGSENWATSSGWTSNSYFVAGLITDSVSISGYTTVANMICSHFPTLSPVGIADGTGNCGIGIGNGTELFVGFGSSTSLVPMKDVAAFKAWLAANPVTIVYRLATATGGSPTAVPIVGGDGDNTIVYDGSTVYVSYTGSGWELISGKANSLYASATQVFDANGLRIDQTLVNGTTTLPTYFHAGAQDYGLFRKSDDKMIAGAGVSSDGKGYFAANRLKIADDTSSSYFDIETSDAKTLFSQVQDSYEGSPVGSGGASDPADPVLQGTVSAIQIGSDNNLSWDGSVYYDGFMGYITSKGDLTVRAERNVILTAYEDGMTSAGSITLGNEYNTSGRGGCGIGGDIIPTTTNYYRCGDSTHGYNYYYGAHTSIQSTSDERFKHDISVINPDIMEKFIMALEPTWYRLNDYPQDLMAGFIAQKFIQAMQEAGIPSDFAGINDEDLSHYALDYCQIIAPLVSVVQSYIVKFRESQSSIQSQSEQMSSLEDRIAQLESLILSSQKITP